ESSVFTIRTRYPSRVGIISKENSYEIIAKYPKVVLQLAHSVVRRLSPFVRQIDFALDWATYEAGIAIYRQGDKSDSTYILLSGRLRSVFTRENGKRELAGEYGRGDLVGIVEVLTQTPRATTVLAVRDSEIAKLPSGLLDVIKIKYPVVVTRLIHLLGHRLLGTLQKFKLCHSCYSPNKRRSSRPRVELNHAFSAIGSSLYLTSNLIRKNLGPSALEPSSEYRLSSWLGQQEDQHRMVLYQCDNTFSAWTQRCIRQADCILIIACADQEPTVGKLEKQLDTFAVRTQKEFVFLHKEDGDKPRDTVKWLNMRSWGSSHHHIRCAKRMFQKRSPSKMKDVYMLPCLTAIRIFTPISR
ncbi:Protein Swiss cheese-like protein, partial [Dinothrombium tinctorium]